jgi:type VI secretion system secreted protein VgrG
MGKLTQSTRTAALKTPLGADVIVLKSFSGIEGMGELFEFQIDGLSEQENINFDQAIGQACTISLKTYQDKTRNFCGILTHAQWTGKDLDNYTYRLVLRPWLWLLSHRANCQIFLDKSVKDIIQKVFEDAGFSSGNDFKFKTSGNYDKIPYCVQYRETDFAFVSRLMEQYGIYYYFEHSDGKHALVLADAQSSHSPIPDLSQVKFDPQTQAYNRQEQHLSGWLSERRFRTGKIQLNDYDYLKPPKRLLAPKEASENYTHSKYEVYDYPGKYTEQDKGTDFAKFRLEAEQALDHRRLGEGDAPSLFPGGLVTLQKYATESENQEYQVVRASHRFGTQNYGSEQDTSVSYSGSYEFLKSDRQFRMLPLTPKPRIHGIQTAKVVGKKGEDSEEISTDENGHIWVHFFWDRDNQKSCPIRVAQVWAGPKWGGQFIPRLGMEVVVEFLEGDPDRPLVTGCVYNGDNKYQYTLPDNKTQSGLYSDSSKGHGGHNEFMFEDKKGSEDIRMHAEKDYTLTVKDTETWTIGSDFTSHKGPESRKVTLKNGDDKLDISTGNQTVTIAQKQTTTANSDITIESLTKITLKVGGSTIVMDPLSITIKSMMIKVEAEATLQEKAPIVQYSADGMMTIKGGIILIN